MKWHVTITTDYNGIKSIRAIEAYDQKTIDTLCKDAKAAHDKRLAEIAGLADIKQLAKCIYDPYRVGYAERKKILAARERVGYKSDDLTNESKGKLSISIQRIS